MISQIELRTSEVRRNAPSRTAVYLALAGLFLLNLLLRLFYNRYDFLNGDEGIRALTAIEMLRGARLYVDVITDKPPGATLFYAAVFRLFPHSMAAVHVAAALWNYATALVLFWTCKRFHSIRTGLWASLLFVYFSTNYFTQDMIAANTEMLMVLPYTLAFFFYLESVKRSRSNTQQRSWPFLIAAGAFTAIAGLFKQVGLFNILFFVLAEYGLASGRFGVLLVNDKGSEPIGGQHRLLGLALRRLATILAGALAIITLLCVWLAASGALLSFWRNTVLLGAFYVDSLPLGLWLKYALLRTSGYILFNSALWALAAMAAYHILTRVCSSHAVTRWEQIEDEGAIGSTNVDLAADVVALAWAFVSVSGAFTGGRFYGHYFIQVLPALAILGARGVDVLGAHLRERKHTRAARAAVAAIVTVFAFGVFRFHYRTAALVFETLTRTRTHWSLDWETDRRQRDAKMIAAYLRKEGVGPGDPLYIWGYAIEIYWQSGCVPASRYLTPYYLTGHFYPEVTSNNGSRTERFWVEARRKFLDDLERTRPAVILNVDEPIQKLHYPEIVNYVNENYERAGLIGNEPGRQFIVYKRKADR